MTGYTVGTLTPDDQPEWRALRLEGLRRYPTAFLITVAEQEARSDDSDRAMLAHGNWHGLFHAGTLVGFAAMRRMMPEMVCHRADFGPIYVTDAHCGTGAAQHLMHTLEAQARAAGIRQLELDVSADNPRAIRFYEALGFVRTGTRPRAIWTETGPIDDHAYIKRLDV
ncbi:MAG: GNAT family N-acetyltransferase [Pseudomonadota bacterium]